MTDIQKKRGRPPKAPGEARNCRVRVYLTEAERDAVKADAERLGISMSEVLQRAWASQPLLTPEQGARALAGIRRDRGNPNWPLKKPADG